MELGLVVCVCEVVYEEVVYEVDLQIISQKQIITSPGLISLAFFVYSRV